MHLPDKPTTPPLLARPAATFNVVPAKQEAKAEGQYVLVLLDSNELSSFTGYQGGRAAARAVADTVDLVMGVFNEGTEWVNTPYVIEPNPSGETPAMIELSKGFNDGCRNGGFVFVSAAHYADRKVEGLLQLHGPLESCAKIIASKRFTGVVEQLNVKEISQKMFYLRDDQLAVVDSGLFQDGQGHVRGFLGIDATKEPPLRVDPDLPIHEQEPRICTSWALGAGCLHKTRCKYSHSYELTAAEEAALRAKMKDVACGSVRELEGRPCSNAETCIYGHVCPDGADCTRGTRCFFQAKGCHPEQMRSPGATWRRGGRGGFRGGRSSGW